MRAVGSTSRGASRSQDLAEMLRALDAECRDCFPFLNSFTSFSIFASGIKICPGKLSIEIKQWYNTQDKDKNPTIQITNVESHEIKVTLRVANPSSQVISKGYSYITDLSWIEVVPETLTIPPKSSRFAEVIIDVPEEKQSQQYNNKWETWVVVSTPIDAGGGINIQTELSVKLFIKTPTEKKEGIQFLPFLLFLIMGCTVFYIIFSYVKKRERSDVVFYFKKKK